MKAKKIFNFSKNNWIFVISLLTLLFVMLLLCQNKMFNFPYAELSICMGGASICIITGIFFIDKKDFWLYEASAIICYLVSLIYIENPSEKIICGGLFLSQIVLWGIFWYIGNRFLKHS